MRTIATQQQEIQQLTDSVNAVQRNFERLSEMYNHDRAELQRLRSVEAGLEDERKALAARHAELESRFGKGASEMQEMAMRLEGMDELKMANEELRKELEGVRVSFEQQRGESEEQLRRVAWELSEIQRKVRNFVSEVANRASSLQLGGNANDLTVKGDGVSCEGPCAKVGGYGSGVRRGGSSIEAELCEAWNCVDRLCVACLEARLELETTEERRRGLAEGRIAARVAAVVELTQMLVIELEDACRKLVGKDELAQREVLRNDWRTLVNKSVERRQLRYKGLVADEGKAREALVSSESCERGHVYEATIKLLVLRLIGAETLLKTVEVEANDKREEYNLEMDQLRAQMKDAEEAWNRELQARQRAHEAALLEQAKWHELAMREAAENLRREWELSKDSLQQRLVDLEEENSKRISCVISEAQQREKELLGAADETLRSAAENLEVALHVNNAMLESYESETRNGLHRMETLERRLLCAEERGSRDSERVVSERRRAQFLSLGLAAGMADAAVDLRTLFLSIVVERTGIVVEGMEAVHNQRLQEVKRRLAGEARAAQMASQVHVDELKRELEVLKCHEKETQEAKKDRDNENQKLAEQLHSLQAQLDARPVRNLHDDKRCTLVTAIQRLVVAEEATECIFSCGLCMQSLKSPLTCVPCGHTFCEDCLMKHPRNITSLRAVSQISGGSRALRAEGAWQNSCAPGGGGVGCSAWAAVRYCPECSPMNCSSAMRVQMLDSLSGNLCYRRGDIGYLRAVIAQVEEA